MYDLMGKDAGVPCWQLFGQQARLAVGREIISIPPCYFVWRITNEIYRGA
jgi:hypothetical protein